MNIGGSMRSQGPPINQPFYLALAPVRLRSILRLSSHVRLGLPKGLFPVGVPAKILKALLPFSILAT